MAAFAAAPDPARERLYRTLGRRNRLVGVLRVAVPVAGVIVLFVVLGAIVLDNLREQFGFSSISIDRDNLIVQSARVNSTGDDGTIYSATAEQAKVRLGSPDLIDMQSFEFSMTPLAKARFSGSSPAATLQSSAQTITIPGQLKVWSDDGMHGTLEDFVGDMLNFTALAHGAVDLTFPRGMRVQSEGMTFDGNTGIWTFNRAEVTLPETPGGTVEDGLPVMELKQ